MRPRWAADGAAARRGDRMCGTHRHAPDRRRGAVSRVRAGLAGRDARLPTGALDVGRARRSPAAPAVSALRGHVLAGLAAPDLIRLEAAAPFGPPLFILVADGTTTTLLLPRDNRVLRGESPAAILGALVGLELDPADLLAILTGCVTPDGRADERPTLPLGLGAHRSRRRGRRLPAARQTDGMVRPGRRAPGAHDRLRPGRPGSLPSVRLLADGSRGSVSDLRIDLSQVAVESEARAGGVRRAGAGRRDADLAEGIERGGPARGDAMKLRAHAKINLSLAVLGARPDGYHELRTVFQSLALHDTLRFEPAPQGLTVACATPGVPLDDRNLVWKAARLVWQAAGRGGEPVGVRAHHQAHSGAGRSRGRLANGAAALVGWNRLWETRLPGPALRRPGRAPGRRRAVLPVRGHGARPRPRRRRASARRRSRAVGRARHARRSACPRRRRSSGGTRTPEHGAASAAAWPGARRAATALAVFNDLEAPSSRRHPQLAEIRDRLAAPAPRPPR